MPSYGWFPCYHCIQGFHLLNWPIPNLPNCAKVFIVCPDCRNTLEFFAFEIDIIHAGEPRGRCAEVVRTGPVAPTPQNYFRDLSLRIRISRRNNLEGCGLSWM
jgi:hypothetical protein